ncbi:DNA-3-methyladenine glycosylase I [Amedibacillus sp. YH-ame6]
MEKKRCCWAEHVEEVYINYHDQEWGVPVHDDHKLFEMLLLESFQAGLSWITILKKRENFREAFDHFDVHKVATYDENKIQELKGNAGIIRNGLKIKAAIKNAQIFIDIQKEYGSFSNYLWHFTDYNVILGGEEMVTHSPLSDMISKDLYDRGMRFVGTVIIYSYLQAVGVINDHEKACYLYHKR